MLILVLYVAAKPKWIKMVLPIIKYIFLHNIMTFKVLKVSQLFETIWKCQIQSDNLSYWPEQVALVIHIEVQILWQETSE